MREQQNSTTTVEERQKQIGLWAAGIFTILSIAFAGISMYAVFARQQGRFYLEDTVLMPSTIIAVVLSILSYFLIRRGRYQAGIELLFSVMMGLPVVAILLIDNFVAICILYIVVFASVMYNWVLPKTSRRRAISIIVVAVLAMIGIEIWSPGFRGTSTFAASVLPAVIVLAAVVLVGFLVRQAWSGSLRIKLVTSFTVVTLISVAIVGTVVYISYRNQVREDIRQRLLNILSLVAINQDGDLHATIYGPENAKDESHLKILRQNVEYLATDLDLKYIYTMRKNEQGQIYFVINARQGGEPGDPIGTIYNEPSELLITEFDNLSNPVVEEDIYTDIYGSVLPSYAPFYRSDGTREGIIGVDMDASKILAKERAALNLILGTTLGTMVLVTLLGLFLGNVFTNPIIHLSQVAQKITAGDLNARAKIETTDEVGDLAQTLNTMTAQLQGTLQGLEQRVADRTRNLELAAEVGRTVSQVRALDVMMTDAAELIRKQFDLYYVQVYLIDPSQSYLNLQAGTGQVGKQLLERSHRLPFNADSINGRAAVDKKSVVITDTTASPTFKPNPLLPDTRSEMAVPLLIGERVVGVLDMQSEHAGSLSTDILPAFEALAGQLAIAIQNANFLAETQQARAEVEAQARRLTRANWAEYLDAIHQPEETGFVFEQNKIVPMTHEEKSHPTNEDALFAPIASTGETLGALVVEMDAAKQNTQTIELINTVARQVAQQVENLRLLDSAERYRAEAEQAARRQTLEAWKDYTDANATKGLSYLYDLKAVRPLGQGEGIQAEESALSQPLKVHDETVGKISVQGIKADDSESRDLVTTIAERLSAHIENLRLSEQTFDRARREQALRQITSAVRGSTDPSVILRTAARELGNLLGRKTVIRLAADTQTSRTPIEPVGQAIANNGNEPIPPAQSPTADGGKE